MASDKLDKLKKELKDLNVRMFKREISEKEYKEKKKELESKIYCLEH